MNGVALHTAFEMLAYAVGFRLFLQQRKRTDLPALRDRDQSVWIGVGAIAGAALGAKLSFWAEDPLTAFANFPDWRHLLQGKSIVGALLGGLLGVEIVKRAIGVRQSSGDAFVLALIAGIAIGRVGCFLGGLDDHTYGVATTLPWGVDFGDGIVRHPTQAYEIAFLLTLGCALLWTWKGFPRDGDRFIAFMVAYLAFRFAIEFIKPIPYVYPLSLSGIQWLCVLGLIYYHRDIVRLGTTLKWPPK